MEQLGIDTLIQSGGIGIAILLSILFYKSTLDRSKENQEIRTTLFAIIEKNTASSERLTAAVASLESTMGKNIT